MKIRKPLWDEITSFSNLDRAARVTLAQGRRYRGEGASFQFNLEPHLVRLQRSLRERTYRHGQYQAFTVYEPKRRLILAAPIRDRVVHHALHDVVAPLFDRGFIFDSYACREGKGTHRAVARAQSFLQANRYFLHLDVCKFFPSLPHKPLKELLRRSIQEEAVLWLFELIIDSSVPRRMRRTHPGGHGDYPRGLPIGNLTSQFLANLYLNELDQFVKHDLRCRSYLRYMDDCVLFSNEAAVLREWHRSVVTFCDTKLGLSLHEKGGIKQYGEGLGFLGFRLFRTHRRLKGTSLNRFLKGARARWRQVQEGERDLGSFEAGVAAWRSHAAYADTRGLLLSLADKYPMMRGGNRTHE